jgi:MGT family glycosyltransferase
MRDRLLRPVLLGIYNRLAPELDEVRVELGAAPVRRLESALLRAPLMLYMTAEPFEYPRSDWPRAVRMVGPGIWEPPSEPPAWLDGLQDPLVLVTCSTEFQNDGKLAETALEALTDEDVSVVVTTAGVDPSSFAPPPNARVAEFLRHGPILERASCVVCHGGMGITQKALAKDIPVCVVPFGQDQLEIARHVEVAGAGSRLLAARLRPDRLRAAIREATGKKAGAEHIAAAFAETGGPCTAADALEDLSREQRKTPLSKGPHARRSTRVRGRFRNATRAATEQVAVVARSRCHTGLPWQLDVVPHPHSPLIEETLVDLEGVLDGF